jgi:2-oxoglutarate ferredoxin oxidoreductase subunit delta
MASRGNVRIKIEECKGCGLCVESCPPKCLSLAPGLNAYGAHPAHYAGEGCTGCGICFYCCPEPGAITVFRAAIPHPAREAVHAPTV